MQHLNFQLLEEMDYKLIIAKILYLSLSELKTQFLSSFL